MALIRVDGKSVNGHYVSFCDMSAIGKQLCGAVIENGTVTKFGGTPLASGTATITLDGITVTCGQGAGGTNDRIYHLSGATGKVYIPDSATSGDEQSVTLGATIVDASAGGDIEFSTATHPPVFAFVFD